MQDTAQRTRSGCLSALEFSSSFVGHQINQASVGQGNQALGASRAGHVRFLESFPLLAALRWGASNDALRGSFR